jgi:hypothetical protein
MEIKTKLSKDWIGVQDYRLYHLFINDCNIFYSGGIFFISRYREFKEGSTQENVHNRFTEIVSSIKRK